MLSEYFKITILLNFLVLIIFSHLPLDISNIVLKMLHKTGSLEM